MKTVLLLGGPAAGQRVEVHGTMTAVSIHARVYKVVPMCSHGEVHWFGVLDGADPLALLIDGYGMNVVPKTGTTGGMAGHDRMAENADRFRKLQSHLLGYVENGGGDHVTIVQDDATRDFIVSINAGGPSRRAYYGGSLEAAFDSAVEGEGDKS